MFRIGNRTIWPQPLSQRLTRWSILVPVVIGLLGCAQQIPRSTPAVVRLSTEEAVTTAMGPVSESVIVTRDTVGVGPEKASPGSTQIVGVPRNLRRVPEVSPGESMPVLNPDPNIEHYIIQMGIDPNIDYKMQYVKPAQTQRWKDSEAGR